MYRLSRSAGWGLAMASLGLLVGATAWIRYGNSGPHVAKDYEDCAEEAQANAASRADSKLIIHCGERFAGRRKVGGGYTYFDFMQNRSFDIAGPNPTEDERKQIDRFYMEFLGSKRREMLLSDLAKAQANQEQTTSGLGRQDMGAPLVLTPKIPLPAKRPPIQRAKACEDGSLACSWAKLSAAVKNAFAFSADTKR